MRGKRVIAFLAGMALAANSDAQATTPSSAPKAVCPDAEVISGKLITDIDWDAIFPIRIAGFFNTGGGSAGTGDGQDTGGGNSGHNQESYFGYPSGAADETFCVCDDSAGAPHPGITLGLWMPAQLIELVRWPGCAPSLGGIQLPMSDLRQIGTGGKGSWDATDRSFYHYHTYEFPLLYMLGLFVPKSDSCVGDGYVDFDLLYLSELDPTWNNDDLAFFLNAESAAFANPLAIAACAIDATAAAASEPLDDLFWCAGSWGGVYPVSGTGLSIGSLATKTSLSATKAIVAQTRRGLAWRTMGNDAICRGVLDPVFHKIQYKMSMFFPLAEANGAHPIGRSAFEWGEWRQIPSVGEDAVYVLWRWTDCCGKFF